MPSTSYAYFKPSALATTGYAYGMAMLDDAQATSVLVHRLRSGRWTGLGELTCQRDRSEVEVRAVSEAEALSGVGRYVGATLCVARVPAGAANLWDYGTVVSYSWSEPEALGILHMVFPDGPAVIAFDEDSLLNLSPETYALRPCYRRAVCDVMRRKMISLHEAARTHFNGIGRRSSRKSSTILRALDCSPVDEATVVPIFDTDSSTVRTVRIKYVLDFSYYHGTWRRTPPAVRLGQSIFNDIGAETSSMTGPSVPATRARTAGTTTGSTAASAAPFSMDQLSDSDLDDEAAEPAQPPSLEPSTPQTNGKRKRSEVVLTSNDAGVVRLLALKEVVGLDSALANDIDQLIAYKKISRGMGSSSDLITRAHESSSNFRPTDTQRLIHSQLVNDKFASMSGQRFLETLQIQKKDFSFLAHPATGSGFYSWGFGFLGLSLMHFARVTAKARREAAKTYDMTHFKGRAQRRQCAAPENTAAIISAIDSLARAVLTAYKPFVASMLVELLTFILEIESEGVATTASDAQEVVYWIDERLELFRSHLAEADSAAASRVSSTFSIIDPSFVGVLQAISRKQLDSVVSSRAARAAGVVPLSTGPRRQVSLNGAHHCDSKARQQVPPSIVKALPVVRGKRLCMRNLSNDGCHGRDGGCTVPYRSHLKPAKLPADVIEYITEHFGGLAPSCADITANDA
ncbi:hypothetical protein PF006_g23519 [Phytophthora fragariae]|uniref:Uncharacterized protein n=1 Tax=Phytophthora fragariae TaxID=53985 RepID=A0A6A3RJ24_9STRA|nr:hypothetical protein PF006_g23519 [Phytophthora fragariae]